MNLKDLDTNYRKSIYSTVKTLKKTSQIIQQSYSFDLTKTEISESILKRLKCFYQVQQEIKHFLNKRYQTPGADFLVETVTFFLKLYLDSYRNKLEVHSERQIKNKRGAIRPDISIWRKENLIAIIECKTQLGWNRKNWENDFYSREAKLRNDFPNAKAFLLVMTGINWGGFENNRKLGKKYFCLLDDVWPTDYTNIQQLMTPIEGLFKIIK